MKALQRPPPLCSPNISRIFVDTTTLSSSPGITAVDCSLYTYKSTPTDSMAEPWCCCWNTQSEWKMQSPPQFKCKLDLNLDDSNWILKVEVDNPHLVFGKNVER